MPSWVNGMLGTNSLFQGPGFIWNTCMNMVRALMGTSPSTFSPDAWNFVTQTLYPWFLAIGTILLNFFCLIGFVRQATNLKENITIEMWIELFIKTLIANLLMRYGLSIMADIFAIAAGNTVFIMGDSLPSIWTTDNDVGAVLAYLVVGLIYLIGSAVCGIMIVVEVMSRYLNLYILVAVAPVALSTWAGGRGIEDTAFAWIKSFLTNVFQIVAIALVLRIGTLIGQNTIFQSTTDGTILGMFSGSASVLFSMMNMFFMTSAVKGADGLIKRAFNLR